MFRIVPTIPLARADRSLIIDAVTLLQDSATLFFTANPDRSQNEYFGHHATPRGYAEQYVAWLFSMYGEHTPAVRDTLTRHDLEIIFSCAEKASDEDPEMIAPLSKLIYGLWDLLAAKLPELEPDDYFGTAAEVSGDYGRLFYSRRMVRVELSELPPEMRERVVTLDSIPGFDRLLEDQPADRQ